MYIPKTTDLRSYPSQPCGWAPPVHEATGGYGFGDIHLISKA